MRAGQLSGSGVGCGQASGEVAGHTVAVSHLGAPWRQQGTQHWAGLPTGRKDLWVLAPVGTFPVGMTQGRES